MTPAEDGDDAEARRQRFLNHAPALGADSVEVTDAGVLARFTFGPYAMEVLEDGWQPLYATMTPPLASHHRGLGHLMNQCPYSAEGPLGRACRASGYRGGVVGDDFVTEHAGRGVGVWYIEGIVALSAFVTTLRVLTRSADARIGMEAIVEARGPLTPARDSSIYDGVAALIGADGTALRAIEDALRRLPGQGRATVTLEVADPKATIITLAIRQNRVMSARHRLPSAVVTTDFMIGANAGRSMAGMVLRYQLKVQCQWINTKASDADSELADKVAWPRIGAVASSLRDGIPPHLLGVVLSISALRGAVDVARRALDEAESQHGQRIAEAAECLALCLAMRAAGVSGPWSDNHLDALRRLKHAHVVRDEARAAHERALRALDEYRVSPADSAPPAEHADHEDLVTVGAALAKASGATPSVRWHDQPDGGATLSLNVGDPAIPE